MIIECLSFLKVKGEWRPRQTEASALSEVCWRRWRQPELAEWLLA